MTPNRPVLYAEDDENDAFFMERAFQLATIPNPLRIFADGRLAMDYLSSAGKSNDPSQTPMPCLVLLDLKMPLFSGLDVLQWIRATPATAIIPVVVFTSSNQNSDIYEAYVKGANGYLVKPGKPSELLTLVKTIKDYWLVHNHIPESESGPS